MTLGYQEYLDRAAAAMAGAGARPIRQTLPGTDRPYWTEDWDQILILEEPGRSAIFAFTRSPTSGQLRTRLDRLAEGLVSLPWSPVMRFDLVAVPVFPEGVEGSARSLAGATPTTYYQGLHPTTWVADLRHGQVIAPGMRARPERGLLEQAARADSALVMPTPAEVEQAGREHARRSQAFFDLMRGRKPVVTASLIAINVAIFLWTWSNGSLDNDASITNAGALVPQLVQQGQWWRLFSAMFLHAGVTHILFNMISLFYLGVLAERLYGSWKFLVIYLGAGLAGSLASFGHAALSGQLNVPSVGASGAIFGVAGALITVRFQSSDVIPLRVRQQISTSIIPLVALNLIFAALSPFIDNSAHIGGLVGGVLLSFLLPIGGGSPLLVRRRSYQQERIAKNERQLSGSSPASIDPNAGKRE